VGKNGLCWRVDNFATVNGRKVRDMSKVSEFCLEKKYTTCMSVHLNIYCLTCINFTTHEIMLNLTQTHGFYPILSRTYSESNRNDHLHTELVQTKFSMGTRYRFKLFGGHLPVQ